ncbi:hypothetical protein [Neorhizobium sp. DT-125]|uniref:hypothetical protein n=1 Tax=Neorhizobium sp. DT-125 TaxID=3396163 RepID=UPI003F1DB325
MALLDANTILPPAVEWSACDRAALAQKGNVALPRQCPYAGYPRFMINRRRQKVSGHGGNLRSRTA